jgi:hypothetical protein
MPAGRPAGPGRGRPVRARAAVVHARLQVKYATTQRGALCVHVRELE